MIEIEIRPVVQGPGSYISPHSGQKLGMVTIKGNTYQ